MQAATHSILWVDDEIDVLEPHICSLRNKHYSVTPVSNGADAVAIIKESHYDVVILDQMMPGQDGIETLDQIREVDSGVPIIMVTQISDELFIEEALGKQIDSFLVKPVGVAQIVSTLKRVLDQNSLVEGQIPRNYTESFNEIRELTQGHSDWKTWIDIYLKLLSWDVAFDELGETGFKETHKEQKKECETFFSRYIEENYTGWLSAKNRPVLSVDILNKYVIPHLREKRQVYYIVVDCMRLDHWLIIEPMLRQFFYMNQDYYYSILPSATLYSRNALFSGLFPSEIAQEYPEYWQEGDVDETSTNRYEKKLLQSKLQQEGIQLKPQLRYFKIFDVKGGNEFMRQVTAFDQISLSTLVVNFVDILTHQRSQSDILQQISPDESAFRSLVKSWFTHSVLFEILKIIANRNAMVILTSDHGSTLCNRPSRAFGNRETSTSLRFKFGTTLRADQAVHIDRPNEYKLPAETPAKNYILAKEDHYFVYPNQFNEYTRQFRGGFQHGGISMGEMILPVVTMTPRR